MTESKTVKIEGDTTILIEDTNLRANILITSTENGADITVEGLCDASEYRFKHSDPTRGDGRATTVGTFRVQRKECIPLAPSEKIQKRLRMLWDMKKRRKIPSDITDAQLRKIGTKFVITGTGIDNDGIWLGVFGCKDEAENWIADKGFTS